MTPLRGGSLPAAPPVSELARHIEIDTSHRHKDVPRDTRPPRVYFPTAKAAAAAAEAAAARGAVDTQRLSAPSHAQCQARRHGVRGAAVISAPSAASPKERGWVRRDQ